MGDLVELARKHQQAFAEVFDDQLELDLRALEGGSRPAVLIEVFYEKEMHGDFGELVENLERFRLGVFELGYEVEVSVKGPGAFEIIISKFRSVARALKMLVDADFLDMNAGAVGILLGYPLADVFDYCRRKADFEFREQGRPDDAIT